MTASTEAKGDDAMTAIQVDPRVIAEALHIGTDDLAKMLTDWAGDALPSLDYGTKWEPPPLDYFDEKVGRARRYLAQAHEAQLAWEMDSFPKGGERVVVVAEGQHKNRDGSIVATDFEKRQVTVLMPAVDDDAEATETFDLVWVDVYTD